MLIKITQVKGQLALKCLQPVNIAGSKKQAVGDPILTIYKLYIHVYTYTYIYTYVCVFMCVYIYIILP